jgi:RNA polymerase sigma-70 factor (family 1)
VDDTNTYSKLYEQLYHPLFIFARTMVNEEEECRDIVEAAFEGLWKHYAEIDGTTVKSYLYSSVRNHCIIYLNRKKVQRRYIEHYKQITADVTTENTLAEHEYRTAKIRKVLHSMDDTTRLVFISCYVDGLKYKDVAEQRGISISTVKKHMVKALRLIREQRIEKEKGEKRTLLKTLFVLLMEL